MENIQKKEEQVSFKSQIVNIETVDDYIFVEMSNKSFLIDKDKNVYELGKFSHADSVFSMKEEIFAVLVGNYKQNLVNIKTGEIILSQRNYYSGIKKIDDNFVYTFGSDHGNNVFNIRTKKFIKPKIDISVKFGWVLASNLFVYETNDYSNYQRFIINQDGELVYKCGASFPYYNNGTLVLFSSKENEVVIVKNADSEYPIIKKISQNKFVNSNTYVHTENNQADAICFVSGKYFTITDLDMNVIKKYPLDIEYDNLKIQLDGDIAVIVVEKNNESYCIALNFKTGSQVKHQGIWILPLDVKGPTVIRGCDSLGNDQYMFTIYDENGNEYVHHQAKDCFNIHNKNMNLYKYASVDGTDQNKVYNIDTKTEIDIPWYKIRFDKDNKNYMSFGLGFRYGDTWKDRIIDVVDEDLNIVFEGIASKDYQIRGEDIHYELKNNLLLLTIPISRGSKTYFRKIVLDKNHNKIYDSFEGYLSFVENYLQVIDENETFYIDTKTGKTIDNVKIRKFALPDSLAIDEEIVKLIRQI